MDRMIHVTDIRPGDYVTGYGYVTSTVHAVMDETVILPFDTSGYDERFTYDETESLPVRYA